MSAKKHKIVVIAGAALFLLGCIMVLCSANFGMAMAHQEIVRNGGVMDTDEYYWIMKSCSESFTICGALLSLAGGGAALLFGKKLADGTQDGE